MERHFNIFGGSPRVVKFVIVKMVKTKQTRRKSEAEKDRRNKYRIAKVPSRFGTAAKVATHDPPVLPGRPGSLRNLPLYSGKYLIQSKLNNVYVEGVERNNNTYTCCVLIHVEGVESTYTECNCTTVIVFTKQGVSNKTSHRGCSGGQHPFPRIAVVVGGRERRHYVRYGITREPQSY